MFLGHVMTYGTLEDIATVMKYYSETDFDLILKVRPLESSTAVRGTYATIMNPFRHCHNTSFLKPISPTCSKSQTFIVIVV